MQGNTLDMNFKKTLVKQQACFSNLSEDEALILADLWKEKFYLKGTTIVQQGEPVDEVFIIVKGLAEVVLNTVSEHHLHAEKVAELKPYQAIGLSETGFYSLSGRRTATVNAQTDMLMIALSVAAFHGFALAYPRVSEVMRKAAASFVGR